MTSFDRMRICSRALIAWINQAKDPIGGLWFISRLSFISKSISTYMGHMVNSNPWGIKIITLARRLEIQSLIYPQRVILLLSRQ